MSQETIDGPSTSPARKTRQQEKEELAYLNDRFASYIEQVRSLKEANLRFEYELQTVKSQLGHEAEDVKKLYEAELADARALIDETAKEKARQQLLASTNASRVKELETEVKELKEELEVTRGRLNSAERNVASMDAQRKAALTDKIALTKQVKELQDEVAELKDNIEELRAALESETLAKVDYQNNLQSVTEDLAFRKKVYEEELRSLRTKNLQTSYSESFEIPYGTGADGNLETAIDELREKSDMDIADFKVMLDAAYKDKIAKLENQSSRDSTTIAQLNSEIRKFNSTSSELKAEIARLQKTIEKLEEQLSDKDSHMQRMSQRHSNEISHMTEELRALRESYEHKIREYEELMDLKVQLDQEIATYRALLQEEENRLNLTPTPRGGKRRSRTQTTEQSSKKPCLDASVSQQQSSISSSCIQICEVDPTGRFVQIKNMSTSAESIGSFKIVHEIDGKSEINFKFHPKSKLQGGASVTVWGSEASGAVHNPPHDIIWRNQPTWGAGYKAVTKLVNKSAEVVATFTQRSESSPAKHRYESMDTGASVRSFPHLSESASERDSSSSSKKVTKKITTTTTTTYEGEGGQAPVVREEHMFHQQGDPEGETNKSCLIS